MGIADRDYMRERWQAPKAHRQPPVQDRPPASHKPSGAGAALVAIAALSILIQFGKGIVESGWLPDFSKGQPFPETGSVYVPKSLLRHHHLVPFTVQARDKNAVVELFDDENRNAFTLFVRANELADTRAPIGSWRVRVIEGTKWHDMKGLFGPNTFKERTDFNLEPLAGRIQSIDLHRRSDGNLTTHMDLTKPDWSK